MQGYIIGNIGHDVELRFTAAGTPVTTITVYENRPPDERTGVRPEPTVYQVQLWRHLAEHAAESLKKGDEVVVIIRSAFNSVYTTRSGEKVNSFQYVAANIALSLRWNNAVSQRDRKSSGVNEQTPVELMEDFREEQERVSLSSGDSSTEEVPFN